MKKKIFLLIAIAILSTGCTVNYNITVDKKLGIKEQLDIDENSSSFDIQYDSPKKGAESIFQNVNNSLKYNINNYKIKRGINSINFNIKNKYDDVTHYTNSDILRNLNGKAEIYKNDNSKKGTSVFQVMINYDFFDLLATNKYSTINVDKVKVNIDFPYKVVSSNADFVDGTVYTWNIKKGVESRSFYIEYEENNIPQTQMSIVLIIVTILLILLVFLFIILFAKKKKKSEI